jgi:hypothetical protein
MERTDRPLGRSGGGDEVCPIIAFFPRPSRGKAVRRSRSDPGPMGEVLLILSLHTPPIDPGLAALDAGPLPPLRGRRRNPACPAPPTFKLRATNPLPRNGLRISRPPKRAQVPNPAMMLSVPSRGRAQGLAILLRRGCVERGGRGLVSGQPWRAPRSGFDRARRPGDRGRCRRPCKGSGAESRIVQGTMLQGHHLPVGGAVAARGEYPRWFGRPSRTAPG